MALCNITGTVYMPNGEPAAVRWVQFILDVGERVEAAYLGAVAPDPIRVRTDNDGNIDVDIITGNYYGVMESRGNSREYGFKAVVPDTASAQFSDIIEAADPVEPLPAWLQQVFAARDDAQAAEVRAADAADAAEGAAAGSVRFDIAQSKTTAERAQARGNMGLGTAATATVTTSATDTTAGRLVSVGWMGLGDTISRTAKELTDWNDATTSGTYWSSTSSAAANAPLGDASRTWVGLVSAQSASNLFQFAIPTNRNRIAFRRRLGGTWTAWREVYNSDSIVGTVSQSGGVPTGAVIERGSNANGEYVRFADGTQICAQVVDSLPRTSASGFFRTVSFAATFSAPPVVSLTLGQADGYDNANMGPIRVNGVSTIQCSITALRGFGAPDVPSGATLTGVHVLAIGRWY